MNSVDLALAFLLGVGALRGYWRGFIRESFGLLALVAGVAAAFQFAGSGGSVLQQYVRLPAPAQTGAAFVAIFVGVHAMVNVVGVILDRVAAVASLRSLNGLAGAAFGAGKGAAVLAFVLLFVHLFPVAPTLDGQIMSSTIGRPLVAAAGNLIRFGTQASPQPHPSDKT